MARNRANITPDQVAIVGDLRFGPGQLLPVGTIEYQINGWIELEPGQGQPRGVKGIPYSITVPVGTGKADIEEAVSAFEELALADPDFNFGETDPELGLDLFDDPGANEYVGERYSERPGPRPLPVAQHAPPLPVAEFADPRIPEGMTQAEFDALPVARLSPPEEEIT